MRKRVAVLLALAIGFAYDPSGIAAMAAENPDKNVGVEASIEKAAESEENQEKAIEAEERKEKNKETEGEKEKTVETEERKEQSVEKEMLSKSEEDEAGKIEDEDSFLNKLLGNFFGKEEKEVSDKSNKKMQKAADKKTEPQETSVLKNLQIPQKLDVVIDPWEIDKKGQVYSEQYTISNTGDIPGILTLSNLACRPREKSGVIIRTDKEGLHDSGDKAIYMEMLFGNGEQIIFSQENSQYQKELMPGEELSIRFAGEVNENAFGKWENNDIAVSVVYSWEMEESADAGAENPEENVLDDAEETGKDTRPDSERDSKEEIQNNETTEVSEKTDLNPEESGKVPETDTETGESEGQQTGTGADETDKKLAANGNETQEPPLDADEVQQSLSDASQVQESLSNTNTGVGTEQSEILSNTENSSWTRDPAAGMQESQTGENNPSYSEQEKEEIKNIDLLKPQRVDVVIDSWKTNKTGDVEYKVLTPTAAGKVGDVTYAQFYQLTNKTTDIQGAVTPATPQSELDALLAAGDVYVGTAAAADGSVLTKVDKGGAHTYGAAEFYYTAADTVTEAKNVAASTNYVYAGAETVGGQAAFRYIGRLSNGKTGAWTKSDISKVNIAYTIDGVTASAFEEEVKNCVNGLYTAPVAPSIATTNYTVDTESNTEIAVNLGVGNKGAKGVKSVTWNDEELMNSDNDAKYENGKVIIDASVGNYFAQQSLLPAKLTITFDMNDAAAEAVTVDVTLVE